MDKKPDFPPKSKQKWQNPGKFVVKSPLLTLFLLICAFFLESVPFSTKTQKTTILRENLPKTRKSREFYSKKGLFCVLQVYFVFFYAFRLQFHKKPLARPSRDHLKEPLKKGREPKQALPKENASPRVVENS